MMDALLTLVLTVVTAVCGLAAFLLAEDATDLIAAARWRDARPLYRRSLGFGLTGLVFLSALLWHVAP